MKLKVGDTVVYPGHGVSVVLRIESKEIFGKVQDMVTIQVIANQMKIIFPLNNIDIIGIRKILKKSEISKILKDIKSFDIPMDNNWSSRYRWLTIKLKNSEFKQSCEALYSLLHLKNQFDLSFPERKMIDISKELLVNEVSLAYSLNNKDAETLIMENLK